MVNSILHLVKKTFFLLVDFIAADIGKFFQEFFLTRAELLRGDDFNIHIQVTLTIPS